jgi:hypothetical protein
MKKNKVVNTALWIFLVVLVLATITDIITAVKLVQADTSVRNFFHYTRLPGKDLIIICFILRELYVRGQLFVIETVKEEVV